MWYGTEIFFNVDLSRGEQRPSSFAVQQLMLSALIAYGLALIQYCREGGVSCHEALQLKWVCSLFEQVLHSTGHSVGRHQH